MSLLDDAKNLEVEENKKHNYTSEDYDLVRAWIYDEVTTKSVKKVKEFQYKGNAIYCYLACVAKELYKKEKIKNEVKQNQLQSTQS